MKRSTAEPLLILAGSVFAFLAIFHGVLGLDEGWELPLMFAGGGCWTALVVLQRRWRAQRPSDATLPKQEAPKARFWLLLSLLVLGTLSGPWWLPYTGTGLSVPALVLTSIISCILAVGVFLIAWRRRSPKV